MKQPDRVRAFLRQMRTLPLSWLSLSRGKRLLIVMLSYWLGVAGLLFLFPRVHNGASMFLPIISACWLFRYRGMFVSLVLNGVAFQLTYLFLLRGMLPDQAFVDSQTDRQALDPTRVELFPIRERKAEILLTGTEKLRSLRAGQRIERQFRQLLQQ